LPKLNKEAEMKGLLKCCFCEKRASYAFLENGLVKHICNECNDFVCILMPTFPLLQVITGGRFKRGQESLRET